MNQDMLEGKWKGMRGQAREWWGELTGDDLEQAGGKANQLLAMLRQKYGYTREKAGQEFDRRLEGVQIKTVKEKAMADKDEEKAVVEEEEKKVKKDKGKKDKAKKDKGKKKDKKKGKKKDKKKK